MPNNVPIKRIGELCSITDIPYSYFQNVFFLKKDPYRMFEISKRKSTLKRIIHVPDPNLTIIQKSINKYILNGFDIHPLATAYTKGSSPVLNAQYHCNSQTLIKIDIQNFFHSFEERDIYNLFIKLGYPNLIAFQLSRLCIKINFDNIWEFNFPNCDEEGYIYPNIPKGVENSYMPQGAPTSPALSNLLMLKYDNQIEEIANNYDLRYTRYSDDIFLSSTKKIKEEESIIVMNKVKTLLRKKFIINLKKVRILNKGSRMIVTGLIVNNEKPQLIKEYKNNLRLQAYFIKKNGYINQALKMNCDPYSYYNHIQGKILWVKSVEPSYADKILYMIKDCDVPFTI